MKQRRVGTFTLGLTLIFIGIIIPISLIFKEKSILLMQFAPLVLVALGAEILYCAIRFKDEKLKYDGLSIFFAIIITLTTLGVATIGPVVTRTMEATKQFNVLRSDYRDEMGGFFDEQEIDADLWVSNYNGVDYWSDIVADDNFASKRLYVNVNLSYNGSESSDFDAVVEDAFAIVQKTQNDKMTGVLNIEIKNADNISSRISIEERRLTKMTKEKLSEMFKSSAYTAHKEDIYNYDNNDSSDVSSVVGEEENSSDLSSSEIGLLDDMSSGETSSR